ncbi:hypothetical protein EV714DRAFT_268694 [Schizophyllum commune]
MAVVGPMATAVVGPGATKVAGPMTMLVAGLRATAVARSASYVPAPARPRSGRERWQRSQNTIVVHSPVHSYVNAIHPLANGGLLTCSLRYGIVARSQRSCRASSAPRARHRQPQHRICARRGGVRAHLRGRVARGYRNDQLAIVIAKKAMDGKAAAYQEGCGISRGLRHIKRATADLLLRRVVDLHEGAVVNVVWKQDLVKQHAAVHCLWTSARDERAVVRVKCARAVRVKCARAVRAKCARAVPVKCAVVPVKCAVVPVKCAKVVFALARGYVACVMDNGDVMVRRGFVLGDAQEAGTPRVDAENVEVARVSCPLAKSYLENLVDALPSMPTRQHPSPW